MNMKNKGLGRGLGAIFETEGGNFPVDINSANHLEELELRHIIPNPKQPRTIFDEDALEELADSIKTLGVIQPITVRKETDEQYIIISGERRWRAAGLAGLSSIPAYVREADDQTLHEMSLVENIQRQDLNAMEIAISLQRLMDECGVTQDTLASRVGKKRSTVANYLRLLTLPPEVQLAVKEGQISMGHAKAIASASEHARMGLLKKCIRKGLSVRQAEELAKKSNAPQASPTIEDTEFPDSYTRLVEHCARLFSEDIAIRKDKNGGGKIVIGFSSDEEIERCLSKLEQLSK